MKVGVIIVNFNKKDLLSDCLKSLKDIDYDNYKIIVVDNGSKDGSIEFVKEKHPNVEVIEMGYNSGFCKANNAGIGLALALDCEGVLLLNNDTVVELDFLTKMVLELNKQEKVGMVSAKILFMKDRETVDSIGLEITPDGLAKNIGLGENQNKFNAKREVFCPAGAAALYSKELLLDIEDSGQFLDEIYEYYFEELDLGWRARLRGWKCVFSPEAVVYHLKSATSGPYSEFIAFYTNRNIFFTIIKNYPIKYAIKAFVLSFLRYFILLFGIIINKGAADKINKNIGPMRLVVVCVKGWLDVLLNLSVMMQKRKRIRSDKGVTHEEIDRWFHEMGVSYIDSIYK